MDTTERRHFHFSLSCTGEGNGNPLQCSCLENLRDGGAWWAAVYGVAKSRTCLKRLSSSSILLDPKEVQVISHASLVRTGTLHVIDIFSKLSFAGPVLLDGVTLFDWIQGNFISLNLLSEELF